MSGNDDKNVFYFFNAFAVPLLSLFVGALLISVEYSPTSHAANLGLIVFDQMIFLISHSNMRKNFSTTQYLYAVPQ
jgi:hypothetical protein